MKLTKEELKQLQKDWEIFLHQNEMSDVLTDDTWNEDYAHQVTLTVREIRLISKLLDFSLSKSRNDYKKFIKQKIKVF